MDKKINISSEFELIDNTAEASISLNPVYQWVKIVVCDSEPNGNGFRVPEDEFDNLITTGINAPIKMARNHISDGHAEAYGNPIGVISQLKKEGNKVLALAALWKRERPDDVAKLKDMYLKGTPPNVSWEILYSSYDEEESGVKALRECVLNGLAIVGMPAYRGRTPFIAMSSMDTEQVTEILGEASVWTYAYIDSLPDSSFLYVEDGDKEAGLGLRYFPYKNATDEIDLPHLQNAISSINKYNLDDSIKNKILEKAQELLREVNSNLEEKEEKMEELEKLQLDLEAAKEALSLKESEFNSKVQEFDSLSTKFVELESEFKALKEFKDSFDAEKEKLEKLEAIKNKFKEAGLEKEDEYFSEKEEDLLKLDEAGLDFMIQELISFKTENASIKVPNITGDFTVNKKEILNYLKEQRKNNKK